MEAQKHLCELSNYTLVLSEHLADLAHIGVHMCQSCPTLRYVTFAMTKL